jgi:hypothetical protein
MSLLGYYIESPAHTTAATVAVVVGATVVKPLYHHHRVQPLQTLGFCSGPCPLSLIGLCTGRWSHWNMTPHHEVDGWGLCPHPVAPAVGSSSQNHEGKEEGE